MGELQEAVGARPVVARARFSPFVQRHRRHHRRPAVDGRGCPACSSWTRRPGPGHGRRRRPLRGAVPATHDAGFALHNLASLPHISVAGACATATHGSGDRNGEPRHGGSGHGGGTADGETRGLRPRSATADTSKVRSSALGGLGVVSALDLDLAADVPDAPGHLRGPAVRPGRRPYRRDRASADSVSLFTEWRGPMIEQVWLKRRVADEGQSEPPAPCSARRGRPSRSTRSAACRRMLDRAAGRARSVARADAPLPDGPHPQHRRGAADRVPAPPQPCGRRAGSTARHP